MKYRVLIEQGEDGMYVAEVSYRYLKPKQFSSKLSDTRLS
jgi:hypothetical protein